MEGYLATAGLSTGSIVAIGLAYKIWKSIKGKKFVSDCCGLKGEVGVDVRDMSPAEEKPKESQSRRASLVEVSSQTRSVSFQEPLPHLVVKGTDEELHIRLPRQSEVEVSVP